MKSKIMGVAVATLLAASALVAPAGQAAAKESLFHTIIRGGADTDARCGIAGDLGGGGYACRNDSPGTESVGGGSVGAGPGPGQGDAGDPGGGAPGPDAPA